MSRKSETVEIYAKGVGCGSASYFEVKRLRREPRKGEVVFIRKPYRGYKWFAVIVQDIDETGPHTLFFLKRI